MQKTALCGLDSHRLPFAAGVAGEAYLDFFLDEIVYVKMYDCVKVCLASLAIEYLFWHGSRFLYYYNLVLMKYQQNGYLIHYGLLKNKDCFEFQRF